MVARTRFGHAGRQQPVFTVAERLYPGALSTDESFSFIDSRMRACGAQNPVFTKNALTLLHQAAGGTLRTLGIIANASLLQAFTARSPQVEAEHVQQVIQR